MVFGTSWNCQRVVSGSLRLNVTLLEILNVTRLDLLLRDLLIKMTLIIKRHFHRSHEKILSDECENCFLNGDLKENVYMDQPMGFSVEGKEHMVCKLKKSI